MSKTKLDTRSRFRNSCECEDENGDLLPEGCGGDCWEWILEEFTAQVQPLFDIADKFDNPRWRLEGLPLWNRTVSGTFQAKDVEELIERITIRGDWLLRYEVKDGVLHANLAHHDAPMGGEMIVKPIEGEIDE